MLKTKKTRRTSVDLGMNKDTWGVVNNNGLDYHYTITIT